MNDFALAQSEEVFAQICFSGYHQRRWQPHTSLTAQMSGADQAIQQIVSGKVEKPFPIDTNPKRVNAISSSLLLELDLGEIS